MNDINAIKVVVDALCNSDIKQVKFALDTKHTETTKTFKIDSDKFPNGIKIRVDLVENQATLYHIEVLGERTRTDVISPQIINQGN